MRKARSSKYTRKKHQYVIDEDNRMAELGKKAEWKTSKIIREDPEDDRSKIVKIEIV